MALTIMLLTQTILRFINGYLKEYAPAIQGAQTNSLALIFDD